MVFIITYITYNKIIILINSESTCMIADSTEITTVVSLVEIMHVGQQHTVCKLQIQGRHVP